MLRVSLLKTVFAAFVLALVIPEEIAFAKKSSSSKSSSSRSSSSKKSSYKSVSSSWKKPSSSSSKKPAAKPKAKPKASSSDFFSRSTSTTAKPKPKPTAKTPSMKPSTKASPASSKPTVKPAVKPKATPTEKKTSSGFGKPTTASSSSSKPGAAAKPQPTKFDQAQSKKSAKASRDQYLKEKNRYASSAETASTPTRTEVVRVYESHPVYSRYRSRGVYIGYDDYYRGRTRYYSRYNWEPPYYAYQSQSRFGVWDAWTWWYVLENLENPRYLAMAYHHRYDPGYLEWRREARRLSFGNPPLRNRLRDLDRAIERMEGTPMIPGYLPEGMEPEVAMAADIAGAPEELEGVVRMATAQPGGNYFVYGQVLRSLAPESMDVEILQSAGSQENLQKLDNGEVDIALAQSDILGIRTLESDTSYPIQAPLWDEFIHIIANQESGIQKIQDLDPEKHTICIGEPGSGSVETWRGFVMADKEAYGAIETQNLNIYEARNAVLEDPNTVMLYVAGLGADFMEETDQIFGDQLRLVLVDIPEFESFVDNDGNQVYTRKPLKIAYPKLQKSWGSLSKLNNLSVTAVLAVSPDAFAKMGETEASAFTSTASEARELLAEYRGSN